jgi:hypothetical protein
VQKIALFDASVTFVVETVQLLGYYFGTKSYPREQYSYDSKCFEVPFIPRRSTFGDQFCSLRGFAIHAASDATAARKVCCASFAIHAASDATAARKVCCASFAIHAASDATAARKVRRASFAIHAASDATATG